MNRRAFGALELISVLAILAIVTALALPRVLQTLRAPQTAAETVNDAHLTQVLAEIQSLQPAIAAHLAQFGSLASLNGTTLRFSDHYDNFGQVLLNEGLIERPFDLKVGTNATLRLVKISGISSGTEMNGSNGLYDLAGDGRNNMAGAGFVLEAVIPGLSQAEASALNDRLDGRRLGARSGQNDFIGRVVYPAASADGITTVHIYLAHK
jgi:hypothetical protein